MSVTPVVKPIPGFSGYFATSEGRIIWHKGVKKTHLDGDGYKRVSARNDNGTVRAWSVARLVAVAFIGLPGEDGDWTVDHIDMCKTNNKVSNLRWLTRGENTRFGMKKVKKTLDDTIVLEMRRQASAGASYEQIGEMFGVHPRIAYRTVNHRYLHLGNIPNRRRAIRCDKKGSPQ